VGTAKAADRRPPDGRSPADRTSPKSATTAPRRRPRRRGRFLRFLQVLFSVLLLIAMPVLAMVLAYGYGNGDSLTDDALHVARDIARLVGIEF
jgi:hypothetical protein